MANSKSFETAELSVFLAPRALCAAWRFGKTDKYSEIMRMLRRGVNN
jgi:hypothetical protein